MLRSLWNGASGMTAQTAKMDIISNNISNINTTAYKKQQANFSDLVYQKVAKNQPVEVENNIVEGAGVKLNNIKSNFENGILINTNRELDIAIDGDGFIEVELPSGELAYTKDGNLKTGEGSFWTQSGYRLANDIIIPEDCEKLNIDQEGNVSARLSDGTIEELGYIPLIKIANSAGLQPIGQNCFIPTEESGDITEELPGEAGTGFFRQGFLESSNVDFAGEVTQMIMTQRAYQINSKSIQTADEMWSIANNIRR